jgi:hypothetical protein
MDYTKSKPGKNQNANNLCTINNKVVDSITCYRNIVSQNIQNPATIFDKDYLSHFNKALPDASAEKKLIMSRCYQINSEIYIKEGNREINLINVLESSPHKNNIFMSYTELLTGLNSVTDFGNVLNKINTNIEDFYNKLNAQDNNENAQKDTKKDKKKIKGCIYALILQIPNYVDISDPQKPNNLTLKRNQFPQSLDKTEGITYYPPSLMSEFYNKFTNKPVKQSDNMNTPITYYVYIIYDSYFSGPYTNSVDGTGKIIEAKKDNTFSTNKSNINNIDYGIPKQFLDKNYLSGAEQCYIAGMGRGGLNYIAGCASYSGPITTAKTSMVAFPNPLNKAHCEGQTDDQMKKWSYGILYTVNDPKLIENIVYMPE